MEDRLKALAEEYVAVRGRLRLLRGKLDVYLSGGHECVVDGYTPADVKTAKHMRNTVNRCVTSLDRYEDVRAYNDEFEKLTVRMDRICNGWKDDEWARE